MELKVHNLCGMFTGLALNEAQSQDGEAHVDHNDVKGS